MRFSVLTLLIALPAAGYAAVCHQPLSIEYETNPMCAGPYEW
jgi:hypothetical protein